jgi:ABC-type amino acid transport substrate-binding protein
MAVKAEDSTLAEALTAALIALQKDGTVARIFNDYLITHQSPGSL